MALGVSLFLIAAGAILAFAVEATVAGVDIVAVGYILMVVGFIGLVLSMLFWASFAPFGTRSDVDSHGGGHGHGHDVT